MNIRTLIVDDEKLARTGLTDYLAKVPAFQLIGTCKNALEANFIVQQETVDLIFLDIQMPELTGLEWLQSLNQAPAIIFTTAYREFAWEGFELNAIDYLVKPISFDRFLRACNKAQKVLTPTTKEELEQPAYIFIKLDQQLIKIAFKDIMYLEASGDYIFIYTPEQRYMPLLSLRQVEPELPKNQFLKVHRSFIVNKDYVEAIQGNQLVIGNAKIPISRNHQQATFQEIIGNNLWKRK